jgi:hypothetical protein
MAGFREFVTGEVLTAANVDDFLMKQSVMLFADGAARDSALGTAVASGNALREGMLAYNEAVGLHQVYDGAAWVPAGGLVQVVHVANTTQFSTTSTSFVDITGHSATITPTSAGNDIIIVSTLVFTARDATPRSAAIRFMRDATAIGISGASTFSASVMTSGVDDFTSHYSQTIKDSPGTTSAVTYKAQAKTNNASTTFRTNQRELGGVGFYSSILLMEVKV